MPEIIMPRLSDTMEEGELTRWLKQVGDTIHKGDVLAEIETDKATMDLESFEEGVLEKLLVPEGTLVPIGKPVAIVGDGSGAADAVEPPSPAAPAAEPEPEAAAAPAPEPASAHSSDARPRTSPLARKIAREHDIDIAALSGSGPQGRVIRADVEAAIAGASSPPEPGETAAPAPARAGQDVEEVPLNNIRKVTARRLTESQAVPHFFLTSVVDVERLIGLRTEVNAGLASAGVKISINDLILRACALALREHPDVNSSWGGDKLLRYAHVNVGFAVALESGLIVPVVRDADRKPLREIATETVALAERARAGKLKPDEFSGGTFSVSNLGMFGIDQFTAVINPPEAAILAVGAAVGEPAVVDDRLVTVRKMKITLTADHRILDGARAAAFLREVTGILQEPVRILL